MLNYFALMECVDETLASQVERFPMQYLLDKRKIDQCEYGYERVKRFGRFLRFTLIGDPVKLYWEFFEKAEEHLHEIALVGISGDYTWDDPFKLELLQEDAGNSSIGACDAYNYLTSEFEKYVELSQYSDTDLRRIINMCRLGVDLLRSESGVMRTLCSFRSGRIKTNSRFWRDALLCGCCNYPLSSASVPGDKTLIRVLAHLLYLDGGSVYVPEKPSITKTIKHMILGQ